MTTLLNLILLPVRAPMVLLLVVVSTYLGLHWSRPGSWADVGAGGITDLIWSAECLQALVVVVVCTLPDLLLQRLSSIMAASRVASLVITLLLVITGGLYMLHLDVLSNVLILASTVLLARLDLVRLRVVTPPFVMTLVLSLLVLGGISLGRSIELHVRPYFPLPQEHAAPAARRGERKAETREAAGTAPATEQAPAGEQSPAGVEAAGPEASTPEPANRAGSAPTTRPASSARPATAEPNRAMPHLQGNRSPSELP